MGAGFRGSSTLIQTAAVPQPVSQEPALNEEEKEEKPETKRSKTSPLTLSTPSSPSKRSGKALSKKQQKLAEAAKNSHSISQYFGRKMMDDFPKNGETTVLEPEDAIASSHKYYTDNTDTQHEHSMETQCTEASAMPVEEQTLEVIPLDISVRAVEPSRTEETTRGFEQRTMLEAKGYDHITPP